jgi:hypothetical protein
MVLYFFVRDRKIDAASNQRVMMGDWLVWGQFLDPNVNQDTFGNLSSWAFNWCYRLDWAKKVSLAAICLVAGSASFGLREN